MKNSYSESSGVDAARFGQNYLQKFGWDSSQGLGLSGDGLTTHIKASQKLDMLGIGAAQKRDPNGIAWKQNRDFENLLKRLNEANVTGDGDERSVEVDILGGGWMKAKEEEVAEGDLEVKKRKRKDNDETPPRKKVKSRKGKKQEEHGDKTEFTVEVPTSLKEPAESSIELEDKRQDTPETTSASRPTPSIPRRA